MMNATCDIELETIERSILKVCDHIDKTKKHFEWNILTEEELWHELVSCILGSQVHYETVKGCIEHLINNRLIDIQIIIDSPNLTERKILQELSKPIFPPVINNKGCRYRYPNSKANYIVSTCLKIYEDDSSLRLILESCSGADEAREILTKKCKGIGHKQASLFLRNISYCKNLAIIDSHVIDFIKLMELNNEIDKQNIANKNHYLKNEKILLSYADERKRSLASLDFAIWIVMRLIKREFVS
jgi:N-glycosylase/DNA lyase